MQAREMKYITELPVTDCMALISQRPFEYECQLGMPLWYDCRALSDTQLLVTFKGGKFRKFMRTQYMVDFRVEGGMTVVTMRFYKEMLGLPPITSLDDIDLFMKQKIQAVRKL